MEQIDTTLSEPVRGWRSYQILQDGSLMGGYGMRWGKLKLTAQCLNGFNCELTPCQDKRCMCECGIYMLDKPYIIPHFLGRSNIALAQVTGWGRCVQYDKGWRVQYCRIDRLIVTASHHADNLNRRYGVEVATAQNFTLFLESLRA